MSESATKVAHGPYVAGYDNCAHQLYGGQRPFLECLCGFRTGRGHQCWMTAGEEFDEHIAESLLAEIE